MDKSIIEKVLFVYVQDHEATIEEGKKTLAFVVKYGQCVIRYAFWGSKLFYAISDGEKTIQEGFVLIDDIVSAHFEQNDLQGSVLYLKGRCGRSFPVPFPYTKNNRQINQILEKESQNLKTVDKSIKDGRKLSVFLSVYSDIFANKGAWCVSVREKDREVYKTFNIENTSNDKKLSLLGLISVFKTLRAMNPNSVTVFTDSKDILDIRTKGPIQLCFENNVEIPQDDYLNNYWNELLQIEHYFSFKFNYSSVDTENEFYKECLHTCTAILSSSFISQKGNESIAC